MQIFQNLEDKIFNFKKHNKCLLNISENDFIPTSIRVNTEKIEISKSTRKDYLHRNETLSSKISHQKNI